MFSLTTLENGDVVAAGTFGTAGGVTANNIARWNGAAWSAMGLGLSDAAHGLAQLPNGDLIAVGEFAYIGTPGGTIAQRIALWNGLSWSPMGAGLSLVQGVPSGGSVVSLPNGDAVVGGFFDFVDGVSASNIARWDGTNWFPLGAGTNNLVTALAAAPNGDVFAGGTFTSAGGVSANLAARWGGCPVPVPTMDSMGLLAITLLLAACGGWTLKGGGRGLSGSR